MQRDEYLPLKVIKERLLKQDADVDEDGAPLEGASDEDLEAEQAAADAEDSPTRRRVCRCRSRRCRRQRASSATGSRSSSHSGSSCSHGPDGAKYYDGDDYIVLSIVKDFFRFGIEPRHLTMYKHFAGP